MDVCIFAYANAIPLILFYFYSLEGDVSTTEIEAVATIPLNATADNVATTFVIASLFIHLLTSSRSRVNNGGYVSYQKYEEA